MLSVTLGPQSEFTIPNQLLRPVDPPILLQAIESVATAILVLNRQRVIEYANSAASELLGVPIGELVGLSWSQRRWHTTLLDGRPVPLDQQADKRALELGESTRCLERRIVRSDGTTVLVSGTTAPLHNSNGAVTGLVMSFTDITQRVQAEERLRHAQKMEAVGTLAGGIAHDFNNLLTAIIGNIAVARIDMKPNDPSYALLAECEKAGWQAADLTKRLLNFARQKPEQVRSCHLAQAVDDTVIMLRPSLPASASLRVRHAPDLWSVVADHGQMVQLVLNLCTNARDALGDGGQISVETANVRLTGSTAVRPALVPPGDYVRLTVSDTGCGMSQEVQERMFEPFFTTKPMGKGTGLGLAVVFGIVKSHGGWVGCESEVGRGTTISVFLPREQQPTTVVQTD